MEEESAVDLLRPVLSRHPALSGWVVEYRRFQGKPDLLGSLDVVLAGYARQRARGDDVRVLVLVDRDQDDCQILKRKLEQAAARAGLVTPGSCHPVAPVLVNRIAVCELEAWYYGDWSAVRSAFPKVGTKPPRSWRNPDNGPGKPSEHFSRLLRQAGYRGVVEHSKREWARKIAPSLEPSRSTSASCKTFWLGIHALASST